MPLVNFLYGKGFKEAYIDDALSPKILHPRHLPAKSNVVLEIKRALEAPIGTPPLEVLARGRKNAVILVCDLTRDVPDQIIVPMLLDRLNRAGIADERVTLVVAGGAHRPITQEEAKQRFGEEVLSRVRLVNHNASDDESLTYIGTSSFGTDIFINRLVARSDLVIGTGCIIPHVIAGYGGGRKIVLPGVAGEKTIATNHNFASQEGVGFCRLHGNIVHEEMMEAARMARLEFIVNVIWSGEGKLVEAVAGDMEAAWLKGVEVAAYMYTCPVDSPCDLFITSGGGNPSDINFYQAVRGMQVGLPIVRRGGAIVLVAECVEGVGSEHLYNWLREASVPDEVTRRISEEGFGVRGEHIAAFLCEKVFPYFKVFLVSSLPPKQVEDMMMIPASTVEEAIELAMDYLAKRTPNVIVNPYGAKVVPVLKGGCYVG